MQKHMLRTWLSTANCEERLGYSFLWSVLGLGFLSFAFPALSHIPYLLDGEVVQGRVTTAPTLEKPSAKFGTKYAVRFEYKDAAGNVHFGEGRVPSANAFKLNDPVPVRYVGSDPSRSRLESSVWNGVPSFLFSLIGLAIMGASILHGIRAIRRVNSQVGSCLPTQQTDGSIS